MAANFFKSVKINASIHIAISDIQQFDQTETGDIRELKIFPIY